MLESLFDVTRPRLPPQPASQAFTRQLLDLSPNELHRAGIEAAEAGQPKKAVVFLERALLVEPNERTDLALAAAYRRAGELSEAARSLRRLLADYREPRPAHAIYTAVVALYRRHGGEAGLSEGLRICGQLRTWFPDDDKIVQVLAAIRADLARAG